VPESSLTQALREAGLVGNVPDYTHNLLYRTPRILITNFAGRIIVTPERKYTKGQKYITATNKPVSYPISKIYNALTVGGRY